jgi:hypothetical protein
MSFYLTTKEGGNSYMKPLSEFNKKAIGWVMKQAKDDIGKISKWYEYEDLLQDGLVIILECNKRYPHYSEARLMNTIKLVYNQHLIHLLRKKLGGNETYIKKDKIAPDQKDPEVYLEDYIVDNGPNRQWENPSSNADARNEIKLNLYEYAFQEFLSNLCQMPVALRNVIRLFLSSEGLKKLNRPYRQRLDGVETEADRLCRLAGFPRDCNFENELRKYLFDEG